MSNFSVQSIVWWKCFSPSSLVIDFFQNFRLVSGESERSGDNEENLQFKMFISLDPNRHTMRLVSVWIKAACFKLI